MIVIEILLKKEQSRRNEKTKNPKCKNIPNYIICNRRDIGIIRITKVPRISILYTNKKADFGRNLNGLNLWACWREVLAGVAIRTAFG